MAWAISEYVLAIREEAKKRAAQESTRTFGLVRLNSWAGYREELVEIVGETPKCYRVICADRPVKLPRRWLKPGEVDLLPKTAVRIVK